MVVEEELDRSPEWNAYTVEQRRNLKKLRSLIDEPERDKLGYVRVMRYAFRALSVSLSGWIQWVRRCMHATFSQRRFLKDLPSSRVYDAETF